MKRTKTKSESASHAVEPGEILLGPTEAAKLFGRSPSWLHGVIAAGHVEKSAGGRYTLTALTRGVVGYFEALLERSTKAAGESAVQAARAREIELRIAQRERDLIPLEDALAFAGELCGVVRTNIDGLPARCTRDLEMRRTIEREVNEALKRISERCGELSQAVRRGDDLTEAAEEEDGGAEQASRPLKGGHFGRT